MYKKIMLGMLILISLYSIIRSSRERNNISQNYKDYSIIVSTDNEVVDFPYVGGNKLVFVSDKEEITGCRMSGFCRGYVNYCFQENYFAFMKAYSADDWFCKIFIDPNKLYVHKLGQDDIKQICINDVNRYYIKNDKIIYENTQGMLKIYDLITDLEQDICWEWNSYAENAGMIFDNIRWKDSSNFYILSEDMKNIYCYSLNEAKAELVLETPNVIFGIIPNKAGIVIFNEQKELVRYDTLKKQSHIIVSNLGKSIFDVEKWCFNEMETYTVGCPFSFVTDNKLYFDNDAKIYCYDSEKNFSYEVIDFSHLYNPDEDNNIFVSYTILNDQIVVMSSSPEQGRVYSFYNLQGDMLKRMELNHCQWDTNDYVSNLEM